MKTTINGMEFEWTPKELKEFLDLNQKTAKQIKQESLEDLEPKRSVVSPTGPKSLTPTPRKIWRGWAWKAGCPIYTISMINGQRVHYANQSLCAKFLKVNEVVISKRKDTGRPVSWYYITTKEA